MQHVCFVDAMQAHAIDSTLGWGPLDTFVWSISDGLLEMMIILVVLLYVHASCVMVGERMETLIDFMQL